MALHCFDKLAVGAVSQQLENLGKKSLVLVSVTLAPVVRHLRHEPAEDLARLVVDGAVHRSRLETAVEVPPQKGGVQEDLLRRHYPQELRLLWETLAAALLQIIVHVWWHRAVGVAAVDKERGKLLELGPQLLGDFDVHLCEAEPLPTPKELRKHLRACLGVVVRLDIPRAAGHLLHHCTRVERVSVIPQDAPAQPRVLVLVVADARLACHMLTREYEAWAADHRRLQHRVRLLVGGVKLPRLVAPAGLQRFAQDVLLGYAREGNRILKNVDPKVRVKLLHLLKSLQEGGNVQVVVVLQPVAEGLHAPFFEKTVAVVVLLQREHVLALELGVPGHVRGQAGEVQLVRAVEPLVREPGFSEGGAVGLDPLLVRDAWAQVVQHVQELELGGVDEHDPAVLLRRKGSLVLCQERDEMLTDELEIVVTRVEAQHRHLGNPLHDLLTLLLRDTLNVWEGELVHHVRYDCCMAALKGLVEKVDQLCRVPGYDVLRLGVQGVRQGD